MQNEWMRKSLGLACLGLSLVLPAVVAGQTEVAPAPGGTASIVERVQRENDPELKELIGIAVTNRKNLSEQERFEMVRMVTQSYAQIKLLDQQIEQVDRKLDHQGNPEIRRELLLAKAELESKRMTELAHLREVMGVIPRFPFESQPVRALNAWVTLQIIDGRVLVHDALRPIEDYWAMVRHKVIGLLPEKETLDYLGGRLRDKDSLPIRVQIYYKAETQSASANLREAIFTLAREARAEMQTDVYLELVTFGGSGESPLFLRDGKIWALFPAAVRRPDGGRKLLTTGLIDPNDVEQALLWRLTTPKGAPVQLRIEYDEASAKLARRVIDTAKAAARNVGLTEVVEVTGVLVEPVPEAAFLGRWEAVIPGEMQTIHVQPGGVCQVTMGRGSQAIAAGANIRGTWLPTTKEIVIDIKDAGPRYYVYRGAIDAEGRLAVDRGVIYPQGHFSLSGPSRTTFKKVY